MAVSVEGLASAVKGRVVEAGAPDYDESRALYNAMIDKRPAAIAYCSDAADVAAALRYGIEHGLRIAVRGGGHNGGGLGSVDDGLVIDLSQINEITVDPASSTVRVGGGALLKDLIDATHEHGLTVPVGIIGTTGVGGLTLGGGVGHLSRAFGLTIDNLLGATVVLADGSVVQTDAEHEPDLFWAIRGGGGNFGVVTEFTFRCHPLTTVLAGPVLYDLDDVPDVMRWYDGFIREAPDELGGWFAFLSVPPGPPFPEELHLRKVCAVVWTQPGEEETPELREGRSFGTPLLDGVAPVPFPALEHGVRRAVPAGRAVVLARRVLRRDERRADRGERRVDAAGADVEVDDAHVRDRRGCVPGRQRRDRVGLSRRALGAGRRRHRPGSGQRRSRVRDWARGYSDATRPFAMPGGYSNFQMAEEPDRVRGMYGANYDRLARVKAHYDPDNVFSVNQNIAPAS